MKRWGVAVILLLLWVSCTALFWGYERQVVQHEAEDHQTEFAEDEFRDEFWSGTFENLQSEWTQLFVQAVFVVGFASFLFKKSKEDMDRLEEKVIS